MLERLQGGWEGLLGAVRAACAQATLNTPGATRAGCSLQTPPPAVGRHVECEQAPGTHSEDPSTASLPPPSQGATECSTRPASAGGPPPRQRPQATPKPAGGPRPTPEASGRAAPYS